MKHFAIFNGQSNILSPSIDHILSSYLYNVMYNMQLHYDNQYVQRIQTDNTVGTLRICLFLKSSFFFCQRYLNYSIN